MKTYSIKAADVKKSWILVDAAGKSVGRVASEIARILRGKHKVTFTPHLDCGDSVVVVNASKVILTGKKMTEKFYHHHSGYMGGIKSASAKDVLATYPERIIQTAVRGMIPHTKLGNKIMKHLRVYAGTEHGHTAQNPVVAKSRIAETTKAK